MIGTKQRAFVVDVIFVGAAGAATSTAVHDSTFQSLAPKILLWFLCRLIFKVNWLFHIIVIFGDDFLGWR